MARMECKVCGYIWDVDISELEDPEEKITCPMCGTPVDTDEEDDFNKL